MKKYLQDGCCVCSGQWRDLKPGGDQTGQLVRFSSSEKQKKMFRPNEIRTSTFPIAQRLWWKPWSVRAPTKTER